MMFKNIGRLDLWKLRSFSTILEDKVYGNSQMFHTYVGDYVCGNSKTILLMWKTRSVETHKYFLPYLETRFVGVYVLLHVMY